MRALDALDQVVRPDLARVLGDTVVNMVMSRAYLQLTREIRSTDDEQERFGRVVEDLCRDTRLVDALGSARLSQLKQTWLRRQA